MPPLSKEKKVVELATAKSLLLWQKCKRDRYFWLTNFVMTKDEHDFEKPVKKFPVKPYTRPLIDLFENEQTFYLAKSRQVQATWLFCALALHTIEFFEHRLVLVISKKQDDAFGLIERLRFIYNRQPLWLQHLSPLDRPMRDQPMGNLFFRNGSKVTGLPEGPDQVRMHTASLILLDEAAFQDNLELTIGACNPSLFGGGKSIVFSSMAPGHFQKITGIDEPFAHGDDELIRGFKVKTNAQGVKIAQLHYSADPDKDPETEQGKSWFTKSSNLYPGGINSPTWRREMEIDPKAGAGERVFPDFYEKEKDIVCDPFTPDHTYSLYGGFDWGTRNAVSFHVYAFGRDGSITAVWEYTANRASLPIVAKAVRECPYYDRLEWIAADPSMWTENHPKKDGFTSIARMFTEDLAPELQLTKLMSAHGRSDMRFKQKLEIYWQTPPYKVKIARNCPKLAEELRNLRYPPAMVDKNDPEKILDKDNHCYSSDTDILTENGWKRFYDLTDADKVAVWQGEEGYLGYEKPKEIVSYDYSGFMYEYDAGGVNFKVTPNHKMWVANQMSVIRKHNPEYKRVGVDELHQVSWISKSTITKDPDISFPDNLIAWYGFWLAEGCKGTNHRGSKYAHVDQSLGKTDRELIRMLRKAGHYSRRYVNPKNVRYSYGVKHYDLVKDNGLSHTKFIPGWLKKASARQLRILIYWMMRGDGTNSDRMCRYNTTSKQLADDFQEVCIRAGYVCGMAEQAERVCVMPNGSMSNGRRMYMISIKRGHPGQGGKGYPSVLSQIKKNLMRKVDYTGKVYCVNTDSGVVYVRRNGKGMWCGNSWDDFKYAVLSHPSQKVIESKPKWGTIEHHNRAYEAAIEISNQTGQDINDIFNEILNEVAA